MMSPVKMSKIEDGMRTVMGFNEALNRHDVPEMLLFMSDNCVMESTGPAPDGGVYVGKDAVGQYWLHRFRDSPELKRRIEDVRGMGNLAYVRWRCEWVDSRGRPQYIRGLDLYRVEAGLIVEVYAYLKGDAARQSRA